VFTEGASVCVVCSHEYDPNDYISDYAKFELL